jgi:Ca2+-transporting ATPase
MDEFQAKWSAMGNASEISIMVAAAKMKIDATVRENYSRVLEIPFSSQRKMMITVHQLPSSNGSVCFGATSLSDSSRYISCVKGAPNIVSRYCQQMLLSDGTIRPMTSADREDLKLAVDDLSRQALRVLAVAFCPLPQLSPLLQSSGMYVPVSVLY